MLTRLHRNRGCLTQDLNKYSSSSTEDTEGGEEVLPREKERKPIICEAFGEDPDTSIDVFGQEFRVHSRVLKMHSPFFAKFMDRQTADSSAMDTGDTIIYRYVAKLDDDGTWGIQPPNNKDSTDGVEVEPSMKTHAIEVFHCLMDALYLKRRKFKCMSHASYMVDLAEFYLALPAVSIYLESCLLSSNKRCWATFHKYISSILALAEKIRSPILFRELFIHVVGQFYEWDDEDRGCLQELVSPSTYKLVEIYHGRLREKVCEANWMLLSYMFRPNGQTNIWFPDMVSDQLLTLRCSFSGNQKGIRRMKEGDFIRTACSILRELYNSEDVLDTTISTRRTAIKLQRELQQDIEMLDKLLRRNLTFTANIKRGRRGYLTCTKLYSQEDLFVSF